MAAMNAKKKRMKDSQSFQNNPSCLDSSDYKDHKTLQTVRDRKTASRYQHIAQINYFSVFYEDVCDNLHVHKFNYISQPLNDLHINSVNLTDKSRLEETLKRNQNTGTLKHRKSLSEHKKCTTKQKVSCGKKKRKSIRSSDSQKPESQVKIEPREFLQDDCCFRISEELPHCNECLATKPKVQYSYCSFVNYRKLYISENGKISHLGFLEPADSNREDEKIWLPQSDNPPKVLTIEKSAEILFYIGSLLCDIIKQEEEGINMHIGSVQTRTWKKFICNTHDACNVCGVFIFNIHWVCPLCAFCVCINCYKAVYKKLSLKINETESNKIVAKFNCSQWCHNNEQHKLETLLLTQLMPDKILEIINYTMEIARKWCRINGFRMEDQYSSIENDMSKNLRKHLCNNLFSSKGFTSAKFIKYNQELDSRLMEHLKTNVLLYTNDNPETCNWVNGPSLLNQIYLIPPNLVIGFENFDIHDPLPYKSLIEHIKKESYPATEDSFDELPFLASSKNEDCQNSLPIPMCIVTQSLCEVEDIPYMWLNHGKLLLLCKASTKHFRNQWKQHLPVIIAGVHKQLVSGIWHPKVLAKIRSSIINCKTGKTMHKMRIKDYWMDFAHTPKKTNGGFKHRLPLKLKEWPAAGSFRKVLPQHFENIMEVLPMPEYTAPDGVFNLASRLPTSFIQPDFGPKIESACGLDIDANCGTTSLCLSAVDAVNILVYTSSVTLARSELYSNSINQIVTEIGSDWITKRHILCDGIIPGALWHIYDILDVGKIRKFLSQIAAEEGRELKDGDILQNNDWYLSKTYNERLYLEYGVRAHTIIQCLGDAVFIPAGVPYQVCNLYNCINVRKTFLSPESVANSLELVKASATLNGNLREMMPLHHIIYHSVKDVLSCLLNKTITDQNDEDKASFDCQELRALNEFSKVNEKINSSLDLFFNGLDE